jgi:hypothetical protein
MPFTNTLVRTWMNRLLSGIATIDVLDIARDRRSISTTGHLSGEKAPIQVTIEYEIGAGRRANHIRLGRIEASRPWLEAAANRFLAGRWLPLPKAARLVL